VAGCRVRSPSSIKGVEGLADCGPRYAEILGDRIFNDCGSGAQDSAEDAVAQYRGALVGNSFTLNSYHVPGSLPELTEIEITAGPVRGRLTALLGHWRVGCR